MTPRKNQVVHGLGLLLLVALVSPFIVHAVPQAVGAEQSYVVLSGSMEPEISSGDVVVIQQTTPAQLETGDVVTFQREGESTPTTHRIAEIKQTDSGRTFVTKGDANENRDPGQVSPDQIVGGVWFVIPFIGHVILFANTQQGLLLLGGLPLVLLVLNEVWNLLSAGQEQSPGNENTAAQASDNAQDEVEIEIPDLRLTLVALGILAVYSGAVAVFTTSFWSVSVAVAAGGCLAIGAALYHASPSASKDRDTDIVPSDGSLDDELAEKQRVPVGDSVELIDIAVGKDSAIQRDGDHDCYFVTTEEFVHVYDAVEDDDKARATDSERVKEVQEDDETVLGDTDNPRGMHS